jgi:hypothetical protein
MTTTRFADRTKVRKVVTMVVGGIVMVAVFCIAIGFVVQFLWNSTVTTLFAFAPITFWQAVGILVLAKIFFGFGGGGFRPHRRWNEPRHWRKAAKLGPDAPDDPEAYREYWREEGKAAFEAYLERKVREPREEPEEPGDQPS